MAAKRFQFSLRTLMIVVTLLVAFVGILTYGIQKNAELKRRKEIEFFFSHIVGGFEVYDINLNMQRMPPKQGPHHQLKFICSWRWCIVCLETGTETFGGKILEAVTDKNPPLIPCRIFCFRPSLQDISKQCMTNVFAITGPGTAFDDEKKRIRMEDLPPELILLAEVRDSGVHWMAPGDFDVRTMPAVCGDPQGKGISGTLPGGFFVAFADGEAWFLSNDTPFAELKKFFTIDECKKHSREKCLGPYRL
jgi:hypothetical protein